MDDELHIAAAVVVQDDRLLLVSKKQAPTVFYLPGGKTEPDETPESCIRRELQEELSVTVTALAPLAVVREISALERVPMKMDVLLAQISGTPRPCAEIAALRWLEPGKNTLELAPAVRYHVVPQLVAMGLLSVTEPA